MTWNGSYIPCSVIFLIILTYINTFYVLNWSDVFKIVWYTSVLSRTSNRNKQWNEAKFYKHFIFSRSIPHNVVQWFKTLTTNLLFVNLNSAGPVKVFTFWQKKIFGHRSNIVILEKFKIVNCFPYNVLYLPLYRQVTHTTLSYY